ncbi:MAG: DUF1553 domain-containing protein [Planctomycetes bacterium]|nr:DUF1553 domain-containing protein [Planctomycetota bacterium]
MRAFGFALAALLAWPSQLTRAFDDQPAKTERTEPEYSEEDRSHWSFLPIQRAPISTFVSAADRDWIATPVDAFILAELKNAALTPAPKADRRTLIRRLYYDLTGLPPTPEQIAAFVEDDSPDAWTRLVDRALASPHYGEKWGQHWLDVIRFAESEGFEYDRHHAAAWRFRDFVVRSLNADKPFDQFATEQLAGDELARQRSHLDPRSDETLRDQIVAAGFHRLGPVRRNAGNPEIAFSRNAVLTEMTTAVGPVFLGLTVGCARCHDHFFDPFKQKDYYRLQAFLAATNEFDAPFVDSADWTVWKSKTDAINQQIYKLKKEVANSSKERTEEIRAELEDLKNQLPPPVPTLFSVQNNSEKRAPIHLLKRGVDTLRTGDPLGMRVPGVLIEEGATALPPDSANPKTTLAKWVTATDNPLAARVIVNRVWQYHFGEALVSTPNDFGLNGATPTHPELLDWLSAELIDSGWSLKSLHRLILNSSTWQQSSRVDAEVLAKAREVDANNRLLWRFTRRRLTAEEIRDSMLQISGELNAKLTGESVITPVDPEMVKLLYKPDQWAVTEDSSEHNRRSVYLIAKRNLKLPFMEVFDQPDLQTSCECREVSTHAPQALELLNGKFSNRMADHLATRLEELGSRSEPMIVDAAFELATGRAPTTRQRAAAIAFLESGAPVRELALAVFNLNGFLYVE